MEENTVIDNPKGPKPEEEHTVISKPQGENNEEHTVIQNPVANDKITQLRQVNALLKKQMNVWRTVAVVLFGLIVLATAAFFFVDLELGIKDGEEMAEYTVDTENATDSIQPATAQNKPETKPQVVVKEVKAPAETKVVTETKIEYRNNPETEKELSRLRQQVSTLEAKNKELMRALTK